MGDRNPKSITKQASQKQVKTHREDRQKQMAIDAKHVVSDKKK